MFKSIHFLIKFLQQQFFIYNDYVVVINFCQGQLYGLYNDLDTFFVLYAFNDMLDHKHNMVSLFWIAL
jgi:uncharacterized membrane protein